jgi:hypothetical protein
LPEELRGGIAVAAITQQSGSLVSLSPEVLAEIDLRLVLRIGSVIRRIPTLQDRILTERNLRRICELDNASLAGQFSRQFSHCRSCLCRS